MFQTCNLQHFALSFLFCQLYVVLSLSAFLVFSLLYILLFFSMPTSFLCIHIAFFHPLDFIYLLTLFTVPSNLLHYFFFSLTFTWSFLRSLCNEKQGKKTMMYQLNSVFYSASYILLIRQAFHIHLLAHFLKCMLYKCLLREDLWTSAR